MAQVNLKREQIHCTEDGRPFIAFTFDVIEKEYGSVEGYLKREVGLTDKNILKLQEMYTK